MKKSYIALKIISTLLVFALFLSVGVIFSFAANTAEVNVDFVAEIEVPVGFKAADLLGESTIKYSTYLSIDKNSLVITGSENPFMEVKIIKGQEFVVLPDGSIVQANEADNSSFLNALDGSQTLKIKIPYSIKIITDAKAISGPIFYNAIVTGFVPNTVT